LTQPGWEDHPGNQKRATINDAGPAFCATPRAVDLDGLTGGIPMNSCAWFARRCHDPPGAMYDCSTQVEVCLKVGI
jgi:hypothetical protein